MAGFRLNPDDDGDIIKDLARFKNKSKRIKEMYRKGLFVEGGTLKGLLRERIHEEQQLAGRAIPEVPAMRNKPSVKSNILKNNF